MIKIKLLVVLLFSLNLFANDIKGIYVGASSKILAKIESYSSLDFNAIVIDVKDDFGNITCELGLDNQKIKINNIKDILKFCKEKGIYTIARIVAFKDQTFANQNPNLAVKTKNGKIFKDKEGAVWLNPYDKSVWEYITNIAENAAKLGFDEIQFDYIRFSAYGKDKINFENKAKITRVEAINQFLDYAVSKLHRLNVKVSADVFGCIIPESLGKDTEISTKNLGQDFVEISKRVDYICPMVYPSHWPYHSFDITYPDLNPFDIVKKTTELSTKYSKGAVVRPWLQAFSATWLPKKTFQIYTKVQWNEQVQAVQDAGLTEFCFWNSAANYQAFLK